MRWHRCGKMKIVSVIGCFVLLTLCLVSTTAAENYKAIILDGYENDCVVSRSGRDYDCRTNRQLYAGDVVIKKPDLQTLKVKWAPYTGAKELDKTSLVVVFDPPKDKKSIMKAMRDVLGFARTGSTLSIGATRTGHSTFIPQPCNNATLLPKQNTTFTWENPDGKFIVFKDSNGTEIFRKELSSECLLRLSPEEIGMKPGEIYTWSIDGATNERQFKIRLLTEDIAKQIADDRRKIRKASTDKADSSIQTALYLQFMSDAYPQDIDLYWLSYLVVDNIEGKTSLKKDENVLLHDIRKNYLAHAR